MKVSQDQRLLALTHLRFMAQVVNFKALVVDSLLLYFSVLLTFDYCQARGLEKEVARRCYR